MHKFIGIVHKNDNNEFGICFPDFLGCIAVSSNIYDLVKQARLALQAHISLMIDYGEILPKNPMTLEQVYNNELIEDACLVTDIFVRLPKIQSNKIFVNHYVRIQNNNLNSFQPLHQRSSLFSQTNLRKHKFSYKKRA